MYLMAYNSQNAQSPLKMHKLEKEKEKGETLALWRSMRGERGKLALWHPMRSERGKVKYLVFPR